VFDLEYEIPYPPEGDRNLTALEWLANGRTLFGPSDREQYIQVFVVESSYDITNISYERIIDLGSNESNMETLTITDDSIYTVNDSGGSVRLHQYFRR
jgi:hypothetical protein